MMLMVFIMMKNEKDGEVKEKRKGKEDRTLR